MEENEHQDETEDWRARPSQPVDKKLKQMELTFRGVLCERLVERKVEQKDDTEGNEEAITIPPTMPEASCLVDQPSYVRRTGKMSKKESKKITAGNGKVSTWLRNVTRVKEMDKIISNTKRMEKEMMEDMERTTTPDPGL